MLKWFTEKHFVAVFSAYELPKRDDFESFLKTKDLIIV